MFLGPSLTSRFDPTRLDRTGSRFLGPSHRIRFWFFIFGWFASSAETAETNRHTNPVGENRNRKTTEHSHVDTSRLNYTGLERLTGAISDYSIERLRMILRYVFNDLIDNDGDNVDDEDREHIRLLLDFLYPATILELA
jgi:hypothetical protein